MIRDIADRGASSWDPNLIGYAIQELRQVPSETTNTDERMFEPVPPSEIHDLPRLYDELLVLDEDSSDMFRP